MKGILKEIYFWENYDQTTFTILKMNERLTESCLLNIKNNHLSKDLKTICILDRMKKE